MQKILMNTAIFLAGGIIGSLITLKVMKNKQTVNEDNQEETFDPISDDETNKNVLYQIKEKLEELKKDDKSRFDDEQEDDVDMFGPQIIEPQELWELDYPMLTLIYYEEDHVLTDDRNKIIANAEELVGHDFAKHFGEYEEDTVYIRNNKVKVYYEILRDYGSYSENI